MADKVLIQGLDKAAVLAALYNNARAQGMGFLHYDAAPMTVEEARGYLNGGQTYFDYLKGRVMKVSLEGDLSTLGAMTAIMVRVPPSVLWTSCSPQVTPTPNPAKLHTVIRRTARFWNSSSIWMNPAVSMKRLVHTVSASANSQTPSVEHSTKQVSEMTRANYNCGQKPPLPNW